MNPGAIWFGDPAAGRVDAVRCSRRRSRAARARRSPTTPRPCRATSPTRVRWRCCAGGSRCRASARAAGHRGRWPTSDPASGPGKMYICIRPGVPSGGVEKLALLVPEESCASALIRSLPRPAAPEVVVLEVARRFGEPQQIETGRDRGSSSRTCRSTSPAADTRRSAVRRSAGRT